MERTQIYLTREEREVLRTIAERRGRTQSEIIREAVDRYITEFKRSSTPLPSTIGLPCSAVVIIGSTCARMAPD